MSGGGRAALHASTSALDAGDLVAAGQGRRGRARGGGVNPSDERIECGRLADVVVKEGEAGGE